MKKILFCLLVVGFMAVCVGAHAAGIKDYYAGKETSSNKNFSDNTRRLCLLTNVTIDGSDTGFTRDELKGSFDGSENFSLTFDGHHEIISGAGAPNGFSGPYTVGENQTLKIMPLRSTLMASLFELDSLKEHDFFKYLQGAYKWDRKANKFLIYSKTDEQEVVLTFEINDF